MIVNNEGGDSEPIPKIGSMQQDIFNFMISLLKAPFTIPTGILAGR
ncbi:MAG TPA: hypothetical protein VMW20_10345 [Candidatus Nanoarchaeia archaeon]|nr:hypothetical protein [Candidatus Nanoarchaeia archaeon]